MKALAGLLLGYIFTAIPTAAEISHGVQTASNSAPSEECVVTPEDYAVYSAILLDRGKPEDPEERWDNKPDLVISDVTHSREDAKWGGLSLNPNSSQRPNDDTVEHFNSRRLSTCHLKPQLDATISYRFISGEELKEIFEKGVASGWKTFYKKYPKSSGYWDFSPVGYSSNGTKALVYLGHHCGGLCGTGHLVLLAKENDRWRVKNRVMLWIS